MWVFALKAEAQAVIHEYSLKLVHGIKPFRVYRNDLGSQWLIVSGIGSINVTAATVFLHQFSNASSSSFWFNVGMAGYYSGSLGELFLIDKITDDVTGKKHFPRPVFEKKVKKAELLTVSNPRRNLMGGRLIDMEGYSFFDIVSRFALREMIAIIKVVSDTQERDNSNITAKLANELILNGLPVIRSLVLEAEKLSKHEYERTHSSDSVNEVVSRNYFTEANRKIAEKLITDWENAFPSRSLIEEIRNLETAYEIIEKLKEDLLSFKIDWSSHG